MKTKKEVIENILSLIKKEVEITNIKFTDGYFLFDFGKDSVCYFKIKGIKRWKFGIWVIDSENEHYNIHVFGQYTDYIDKFKPTASPIHIEFEFNKDDNYLDKINEFCDVLLRIKYNNATMLWYYYSLPKENRLRFLLSEFFYYRIKEPIKWFISHTILLYYLKLIKFIYKLRFKKLNIVIKDISNRRLYPEFEFNLYYDKCEEIEIFHIYHIIEQSLLLHKKINRCCITHYENINDKKGFYYRI